MKKILIIMLIVALNALFTYVHADVNVIKGLQENYDELWLNYYVETGIKEEIERKYLEYCKNEWSILLTAPKSARAKIGYTGTLEEQEATFWEDCELQYDNGFGIWIFDSEKYLNQYVKEGIGGYLINSENYWAVPLVKGELNCKKFRPNGEFENGYGYDYGKSIHIPSSFVATRRGQNYLKDITLISNDLWEAGIVKVDDIKIMIIDSECTALYIKSGDSEYLIRIHEYYDWVPEFEMFKVYKASDAINLIANSTGLMSETKETFEAEAGALQNDGLLKGNERGLDLLKPLTRIEAVTMLLRAIGQEPTAATLKETFADVPITHWGCAATVKAEELGIVNGVGDNLFAPDKQVTATEFSTMVLRAAQETDFDWTQALNTLVETGIITDEDTEDMSLFTRGDMAKIIYEARNKGLLK